MALTELYQEDRDLVPHPRPMWQGYVLSGWWRRVGASLLDSLIVLLLGALIAIGLGVDWEELENSARAAWREVVLKTGVSALPGALWFVTLVDDLWPLWDPQNRPVHDMLAGTRVRADVPRRAAMDRRLD